MLKSARMDNRTRQLVQALHDHPAQLVLVAAGAGTQALSLLLGVSGASRTVLEAIVPYSAMAFDEFLEQTPDQYVSAESARLLAGRALTRARWLRRDAPPVIGLACTATIITDRPKRGEHRAHIALWHTNKLIEYKLNLSKGTRDRAGEEEMVSHMLLNALAEACELPHRLPLPLLADDKLEIASNDFNEAAHQLAEGQLHFFSIQAHGLIGQNTPVPQALLAGAFNPLHDGHLGMANAASKVLGKPVAFEVTAVNADKPRLPIDTLLDRLTQFAGRYTVYTSNAPTFAEKAEIYPGTTFIVGYDTAVRILHP
ncbi:MAG: hypothetical protein KC413_13990, partial [Anaerolineales bacterium]|nr:hypothetical protein [Anaerolineales bacterium]